jgi:hypothetical protein
MVLVHVAEPLPLKVNNVPVLLSSGAVREWLSRTAIATAPAESIPASRNHDLPPRCSERRLDAGHALIARFQPPARAALSLFLFRLSAATLPLIAAGSAIAADAGRPRFRCYPEHSMESAADAGKCGSRSDRESATSVDCEPPCTRYSQFVTRPFSLRFDLAHSKMHAECQRPPRNLA